MDSVEKILLALAAVVTAFGGASAVRFIANRTAEKREANAKAYDFELQTLRKQYDWLQTKYDTLNTKVDGLYNYVHELENKNLALLKRNGELELELKEAMHNQCLRPDEECLKRLPKRTYCRLKKLAAGEYDDFYKKEETSDEDNGVFEKPDKG